MLLLFAASFLAVFGCSLPTYADDDLDTLGGELIYYYVNGDETDILRTLDSIKALSESDYETWQAIIDEWTYIDSDEFVEYTDIAPDGLPTTNTHAFVVLGYQLNADGSLQDEAKGRCQVAYASAMKYPNAYVVLAGGGTAKNNADVTEAGQMEDYLVNTLGLDESRIILEDESKTTVQNAQNTFEILYNDYDIDTITIISSQYHLKRATLLYYAQSLLSAAEYSADPIELIANAGWVRSDKSTEGVGMEAMSLSQIMGVSMPRTADVSTLQSITLSGTQEYTVGDTPAFTVTAQYDIDDYTRDVTTDAVISGYDMSTAGTQTVTATYTENDVTATAELTITVSEAATDTTTDDDTTTDTDTETDTETDTDTDTTTDTTTDTDTDTDTGTVTASDSDSATTSTTTTVSASAKKTSSKKKSSVDTGVTSNIPLYLTAGCMASALFIGLRKYKHHME